MLRRLAAVLALTTLLWLPTVTPPPAVQASSCTAWPSARIPPATIRVMRTSGPHSGYVEVVDFKTYVQKVLAVEWPSNWSSSALQVGAMAVKQYGWYFAMHYRGGTAHGACYDIIDTTTDQIYRPESSTSTPSSAQLAAVDATWTVSATKNGSFLMTGYRSGASVGCGLDADGNHLFQHSSKDCAAQGMNVDQIMSVYFPGVVIYRPAPLPAAEFLSPADGSQMTVGPAAVVAWTEEPAAGATINSRVVSLVAALPAGGKCTVDRWVPASPAWQSTAVSPLTVTGLKPGLCYRVVVTLADSNNVVSSSRSGTMLAGAAAATAVFSSPLPNVVTAVTGPTAAVRWTETPAAGTHVVGRLLTTELAAQPAPGTCAGASWSALSSTTAVSPVTAGSPGRLICYRFRLTLTDSAGHTSVTYSGALSGPSA
jgi:hypothetical protein